MNKYTIHSLKRYINDLYQDKGIYADIEVWHDDTTNTESLRFIFMDRSLVDVYDPFSFNKDGITKHVIECKMTRNLDFDDSVNEYDASLIMSFIQDNMNSIIQNVKRSRELRQFKEKIA